MLFPGRLVAGRLTRVSPVTQQIRTLSGWVALFGSIGACGGSEPRIPTTVSVSPVAVSLTALGQTQQLVPSVTDQNGNSLDGATVAWSSTNTGVATVSQSGVVTAVGTGSGDIVATSGSAIGTAGVTVAQTPAQLLKISGDAQIATAGTTLLAPLVVQINDPGGSPIQGQTASFSVAQGDGSIATATAVTGSDGRASTTFTTGTVSGSAQAVSVSIIATTLSVSFTATAAPDPTTFNIGLQYLSTVTAAQRQAFTAARLRWQGAITGDLEDGLLQTSAACGAGTPAFNQVIDDVVILVNLVPIDGAGQTLASAGPCWVRDPGLLSILGIMEFDTADLPSLESAGELSTVVLHEMAHVLGFGLVWDSLGLIADPSLPPPPSETPIPGADPHFTGTQAIGEFDDAGGATYTASAKVPVENAGGRGTADSHWRESVLVNELMTGYINPGQNPLSRLTIAALADQGYTVDFAAADSYSFLSSLRALASRPVLHLKNDILRGPIRKVGRDGRLTGEVRR